MAETKEYVGITRATLDCLRQRLESRGIIPPAGDSGTFEQQGVKVSLMYIEAEGTLQFDIVERPFFVPEDLVWTLLDGAVRGCAEN
jgi:hypothetical protein